MVNKKQAVKTGVAGIRMPDLDIKAKPNVNFGIPRLSYIWYIINYQKKSNPTLFFEVYNLIGKSSIFSTARGGDICNYHAVIGCTYWKTKYLHNHTTIEMPNQI